MTSMQLLPQSPEGILQSPTDFLRILTLKKALIDLAISALENFFIRGNTYEFDAHVGETLCQIRAYHIYLLKLNHSYCCSYFDSIKKIIALQQLSYRLTKIIQYYQPGNLRQITPQPIISFFKQYNIVCGLSEMEVYIIQLHLLSRFKFFDTDGVAAIDYKKMCKELNISKHMARRIIHLYQLEVSQYSVNFVQSLIMNRSKKSIYADVFNKFKKIDEEGRLTLPCYWVMSILYEDMIKKRCPILIVCNRSFKQQPIDTIYIAFKPSTTSEEEYEYCPLNQLKDTKEFYFVLEGVVDYDDFALFVDRAQYINRFVQQGLRNILFANMAIHPQYSGRKLFEYKDNPYLKLSQEIVSGAEKLDNRVSLLENIHLDQQKMKTYALKLGYGKYNSDFFYIFHIFCDTLAHQLQLRKPYKYRIMNRSASLYEMLSYKSGNCVPEENYKRENYRVSELGR